MDKKTSECKNNNNKNQGEPAERVLVKNRKRELQNV